MNGNTLITEGAFGRMFQVTTEGEIVWEYKDSPVHHFYSCHISGARRLVNGNTLIVEGGSGRMFQVTPSCEVVWEYINPYFNQSTPGMVTRVFPATHYQKHEIPFL